MALARQQPQQQPEGAKAPDRALRRFQCILEEGHAAAGTITVLAVTFGLLLGFLLPKDTSIPGMLPYQYSGLLHD